MRKTLTGLTMALLATSALATFAPDWVNYGLMPDGSMHSWNQRTVQQDGGNFSVMSRLRYASPQPVPGTGSKYRPAKTAYTSYLVNCPQRLVQAVAASYRDESDGVILNVQKPGPVHVAEPEGDKIRDRFYLSVCTTLKDQIPPQPLR